MKTSRRRHGYTAGDFVYLIVDAMLLVGGLATFALVAAVLAASSRIRFGLFGGS